MTNYEKIKAMSVEEMADLFYKNADCKYCPASGECGAWENKLAMSIG